VGYSKAPWVTAPAKDVLFREGTPYDAIIHDGANRQLTKR
jgi:hypothetical protein